MNRISICQIFKTKHSQLVVGTHRHISFNSPFNVDESFLIMILSLIYLIYLMLNLKFVSIIFYLKFKCYSNYEFNFLS